MLSSNIYCTDVFELLQEGFRWKIWLQAVHLKCHFVCCFFLINWNTKLIIRLWFSCLYWGWDIECRTKWESVYQKYNSFFDLKTKRILKFFHFSFLSFITKIEKQNNFLKFIFWFQNKKWIRKFRFLFSEVGFKSK